MSLRRLSGMAVLVVAAAGLGGSCSRRPAAEVNPIQPSITVNRTRAPLGSAIEITYTWTLDSNAKKLTQDYRALVHFLDSHKVMLFDDDHVPEPPPATWEPGQTYTYTRTVFVPIIPYVGDVQVRTGLYPASGKGERIALKGEDQGMREYKVAQIELLPQTENIFLVYKEGWHGPEVSPQNPSLERMWTKQEALVSFKNPKAELILYLEADTNYKAFKQPPVLTVSVNNASGIKVPIESSEVFLKKVRFKADQLGQEEWVDLRLTMSESFVPKDLGLNQDVRVLGLLVYHLYVGEADKVGTVPAGTVVDAGPVAVPSIAPAAAAKTAFLTAGKTTAAKTKAPVAK